MSLNIECTSEKVLQLFKPPKSAQKRIFVRINVFLNNMKRLNINNLQNHKFLFKNLDLFTFSELPYRSFLCFIKLCHSIDALVHIFQAQLTKLTCLLMIWPCVLGKQPVLTLHLVVITIFML